jgi:hypothetical protein
LLGFAAANLERIGEVTSAPGERALRVFQEAQGCLGGNVWKRVGTLLETMGVLARGGHFVTLSQGERIKPQRNPPNILGTEKFTPAQKNTARPREPFRRHCV